MDHQYTQDGLTWDALKGTDRVKARVLAEAAQQAGCRAYLALLTLHVSGSAEYEGGSGRGYGYGRRRSWYGDYDDEGDASDYEMGEIYETSLTADHWSDPEGHRLPIGELDIEEAELLDSEALREGEPSEEDFEGYTGNAGMTLDRWYRNAAVFVWPASRHFEVICDRDSRAVVPELVRMVASWKKARGEEAAALEARCREFAAAIVAKWPARAQGGIRPDGEDDWAGELLAALAALDDPGRIGDFLGDAMTRDATAQPGKSIAAIGQKFGWTTFRPQLASLIKATTPMTMERNVRLLESICTARLRKKEGWSELCEALASELVSAIGSIDRAPPSSDDWRYRALDRVAVLGGLARSLIATEQDGLLSRFIDHALALPQKYPLRDAHIKAVVGLRTWLSKNVKKPSAALAKWLDEVRDQLSSIIAEAPQEPTDFRRAAPIECKCADCAELKRFLADPAERVHRFKMGKERRRHLHSQIDVNKIDLTHVTDRIGSPQTLVCTKTTASYQASLKKYREDREYLGTIEAIRASLPG